MAKIQLGGKMISINEYLLSKNKVNKIIYATDETLYRIVRNEIEKLGKDADLNHIDVSEVKNFFYGLDMDENSPDNLLGLFEDTDFHGDVSEWDMSKAEDTNSMFYGCEKFNCDLSKWDMNNVKVCRRMFERCTQFDQDLSSWDMRGIKDEKSTRFMFNLCKMEDDKSKWPKFYLELEH